MIQQCVPSTLLVYLQNKLHAWIYKINSDWHQLKKIGKNELLDIFCDAKNVKKVVDDQQEGRLRYRSKTKKI